MLVYSCHCCCGKFLLLGYHLPWEAMDEEYPSNFASPSQIAIGASDGASDYGNKFGEPLLTGFARSFGLRLHCGERREYVKPIMFSGGIGTLSVELVEKMAPCTGRRPYAAFYVQSNVTLIWSVFSDTGVVM